MASISLLKNTMLLLLAMIHLIKFSEGFSNVDEQQFHTMVGGNDSEYLFNSGRLVYSYVEVPAGSHLFTLKCSLGQIYYLVNGEEQRIACKGRDIEFHKHSTNGSWFAVASKLKDGIVDHEVPVVVTRYNGDIAAKQKRVNSPTIIQAEVSNSPHLCVAIERDDKCRFLVLVYCDRSEQKTGYVQLRSYQSADNAVAYWGMGVYYTFHYSGSDKVMMTHNWWGFDRTLSAWVLLIDGQVACRTGGFTGDPEAGPFGVPSNIPMLVYPLKSPLFT